MTLYASGVNAAATNLRCALVNEGGEILKEIRERAKGISGRSSLNCMAQAQRFVCLVAFASERYWRGETPCRFRNILEKASASV